MAKGKSTNTDLQNTIFILYFLMLQRHFQQYFSYIMATSLSGGRSRREPTGKLDHLRLRVECTLLRNLQSRARTHAVFVIGLYELLGNPTT
jgi:hypothetical protein